MKSITRILCLLLLACMMISVVACAQPGEGNETTTGSDLPADPDQTTAGGEQPPEGDVTTAAPDDLGDLSFGGETINFLSRDTIHTADEIAVEGINGEIVNDAVYERELAVESRLNVFIENEMLAGGAYVVSDKLRQDVKAGLSDYEIIANSTYSTIMYTGEKIFRDLSENEYINLSKPYWSQGFNEAASFGDTKSQFLVTGALSLAYYRYMFATFFNQAMFEQNQLESLYDVVENGKWTLDYQYEIAQSFFRDMNGDLIKDEGDIFGFVTCTVLYCDPYWSSCEILLLDKNDEGMYEYALDVDRLHAVTDKIIKLWTSTGSYYYKSSGDDSNETNLANHFSSSGAAMATMRLSAAGTEQLRKMSDRYGIVPIPKYEESQTEYYTYLHDQFTSFGISSIVADDETFEICGAVLEAMASYSSQYVLPAYYETTLKGKYLDDPKSWEMLDRIYNGVYIDAGILYDKNLNSAHQWLRNIIVSGVNTVSSQYGGQKKALGKCVENLNEDLLGALD